MAKLKMSIKKWAIVFQALKDLDGYKDGDKVVRYVFGEPTQLKVTRNMIRIEKAADEYEKSRSKLIKDAGIEGLTVGDPKLTDEERKKMKDYFEAVGKMQEEEVEIATMDLTVKELSLDKNNLPRSVLASLAPLIPEMDQE